MRLIIAKEKFKVYEFKIKADQDGTIPFELEKPQGFPNESEKIDIYDISGAGCMVLNGEVVPSCKICYGSTETMFALPEADDGCIPIFLCLNCISKMYKLGFTS